MFLKSPKRVEVFKKFLPGVPLPPEPVVTRWGTWLSAASYYFEHFEEFKKVVHELEDDGASVKTAKSIIDNPKLRSQLIFIQSNFNTIPATIEGLQSQDSMMATGVETMQSFSQKKFPGPIGEKIQAKVRAVLERNCGFQDLKDIASILGGSEAPMKEDWTMQDILSMKFAPVTSSDVERSFSKLKYLLSDRRLNFSLENLSAHLILFYNHH